MSEKKVVRGKDLRASIKYITIDGQRLKMVFSNWTYYMVEDIYEREYDRDYGFERILQETTDGKFRGIIALAYAALKAGGNDVGSFKEFMNTFDIEAMTTVSEDIMEGVAETLPDVDEEETKNA